MKNKKITLGGLLIAAFLILSFVELKPITVTDIRETMLMSLFTDYEPADTLITIGNDADGKLHPASLCGWDPSFMASSFGYAVDTAYLGYESIAVSTRLISLFGANVISGQMKLAEKDYKGNPIQIYKYNGAGLLAVFNKLYQKPTTVFKGIVLQKLYNVSAKQYLRDATDVVVGISAKKAIWDAEVKRYLLFATTKEEFYMDEFAYETINKIFGDKEMSECAPSLVKMIGSMLRRGGDGSLPTLFLCLKTILKDYDPDYYNKVALKF